MKKYIILLFVFLFSINIVNGYNNCDKEKEKVFNIYKIQKLLDEKKSGLYDKYKSKFPNAEKIDILNNVSYKNEMRNIENQIEKVEEIYSKYKDEYEKCKLGDNKNSNSIKDNKSKISNNKNISGYTPTTNDKKLLIKIKKLIDKKLSKSSNKLSILLLKIDKSLLKAKEGTRTYYLLSEIKKIIISNSNYKSLSIKTIKQKEKFNLSKVNFLKLNKFYKAKDGLLVKISEIKIKKKEGYDLYTIKYVLKNSTKDKKITEGTFKSFYETKKGGVPQYGFFSSLFPGESKTREYTFKSLKNEKLGYFAYGNLFSKDTPDNDSLIWKFNY